MKPPTPHFMLVARTSHRGTLGDWKFVLQSADGAAKVEAADSEPDVHGERLELLTVIRGLEALDQPSRVTILSNQGYVRRGLDYGLEEWRANGWTWEFFGRMVPVKNSDLWQRLDQAMRYHQVEFSRWRIDPPHGSGSQAPRRTIASGTRAMPAAVPRPHFDRVPATAATVSPWRGAWQSFVGWLRGLIGGSHAPQVRWRGTVQSAVNT